MTLPPFHSLRVHHAGDRVFGRALHEECNSPGAGTIDDAAMTHPTRAWRSYLPASSPPSANSRAAQRLDSGRDQFGSAAESQIVGVREGN
jgi:hypothetical protein